MGITSDCKGVFLVAGEFMILVSLLHRVNIALKLSLLYTEWAENRFIVVSTWNTEFLYYCLLIIVLLFMKNCKPTLAPHCTCEEVCNVYKSGQENT